MSTVRDGEVMTNDGDVTVSDIGSTFGEEEVTFNDREVTFNDGEFTIRSTGLIKGQLPQFPEESSLAIKISLLSGQKI